MNRCFFALAALAMTSVSFAETIETYTGWNGTDQITSFGTEGTSTYGQSFVAPADSFLKSYETTFVFNHGEVFGYRFYVSQYDAANQKAVGSPLFASGDLQSPAQGAGFVDVSVDTNIALTAGQTYVAFYTISGIGNNPTGDVNQGFRTSDTYAGGQFLYANNTTLDELQSAGAFGTAFSINDSVFRAEFAPVPEPTSFAVLGLGGLALLRRRRR